MDVSHSLPLPFQLLESAEGIRGRSGGKAQGVQGELWRAGVTGRMMTGGRFTGVDLAVEGGDRLGVLTTIPRLPEGVRWYSQTSLF